MNTSNCEGSKAVLTDKARIVGQSVVNYKSIDSLHSFFAQCLQKIFTSFVFLNSVIEKKIETTGR